MPLATITKDVGLGASLYGRLAAALCVSMALAWTCVARAEDLPKPDCKPFILDGLKMTSVGSDIIHNGQPLTILRFDSSLNDISVLEGYRRAWKSTANDPLLPMSYAVEKWRVVSKIMGTCLYTVQARQVLGGSTGMIGISQMRANPQLPVLGKYFPKMSDSIVMSDITHRDPGKNARTIMLVNAFSPDANADFYRRTIGNDGWVLITDNAIPMQGSNRRSYAFTFRRGQEETSMAIAQTANGSSVLVNWVDKP